MLLFRKSDVERDPSVVRVEYGGKPVARAYPPYYTRNLRYLYQRKIPTVRPQSASAAEPPANGLCTRENALGWLPGMSSMSSEGLASPDLN